MPSRNLTNLNSNLKGIDFLKRSEEMFLLDELRKMIELETNIEDIKKKLTLRSDFNGVDAFNYFDPKGKGYITVNEFEHTLIYLNIHSSTDEIYLFFKNYDTDNDGLLKYSDFCKLITA